MHASRFKLFATIALTAILTTAAAHATLLGSLVNVSGYYPDSSSLYQNGGDKTVSAGVEYVRGTFSSYSPDAEIDISGSQMTISYTAISTGGSYTPATFNGWVLTILSGPVILSATANGGSGFSPLSISVLNGNQLFLNYQGVTIEGNLTSIIDIETAPVPEPSTYLAGALLVLVFGVQGVRSLRRRKQMA